MKKILITLLALGAVMLRAQTYPPAVASAITIETTDTLGSLVTTTVSTTTLSRLNLSQGVVTLSGASLYNAIVAGGGTSISQSGGILYIYSSGGGGGGGSVASVTISGGLTGLTFTETNPTTTPSGTLTGTLAAANGGTGTNSLPAGQLLVGNGTGAVGGTNSWPAGSVSGVLAVANGGTGTTSPGLVAGSNISVTGTWPNQTVAASGGGSGTVASVTLSGGLTGLSFGIANPTTTPSGTLTGTLAAANGGTGTNSLPAGQLLVGNGTGAVGGTNSWPAGSLSGTLGTAHGGTGTTSAALIATNNLSDLASLGAARTALNIQYPSGSHFLFSATTSGPTSATQSFATAPFVAQTDPYGYFGNANLGASGSYSTAYVCPVSGPVLFGSQINDLGGGTSGSRTIAALFEEGTLVAVTFDWLLPVSGSDTHMASSTIWNATAGKRYQMELLTFTGSFNVYTGSVFYAQQASPLSARFTAAKVFATLAAAYTASCSFTPTGTFSGYTAFYPDTGGVSYPIMDIRDTAAAIRYAPANFTATQIANIIAMYGQSQVVSIAGGAGAGIPECINTNSTFGVVADHAPDSTHVPDLDGVYDWVDLMYSHYLKTGSATQYATYATSVSAALASNTIDNHLVYINPSVEGPPGWGFQDSIDIRGHDLFTSVERYRAYKQIAAMVAANSGDPSSWNAELPNITSALDTYLFNSGSGLFLTCDTSTQSNNVPNIPGSCYAVYIGAASTTSSAAIVAACHNGYTGNAGDLAGHGFVYGGQVRHMPRGTYFTTFRSSTPTDTYQNGGYWMFFAPWYAYCLAKNDVTEAEEFLNEAANFSLAKPSVGATESYGPQANSYLGANQYLDSACAPLGYYNGIQF